MSPFSISPKHEISGFFAQTRQPMFVVLHMHDNMA